MSVFSILVILATVASAIQLHARSSKDIAIDKKFVDSLNSQNIPWLAELPSSRRLRNATLNQIKSLLGVKISKSAKQLPIRSYNKVTALPATFEAKDKWPQCPTITQIRDQSACGSCWAIAAAEAISDRYCTFGVNTNLPVSTANLMECCWYCGSGCNGGDPSAAWSFWVDTGLFAEACQPYPFPKCEHHISGGQYPPCPKDEYPTPSCSNKCNTSGMQPTAYKGKSSYNVNGETDYMNEVYNHGPIEVAFSVYADFVTYKSGVYTHVSGQYLGGHAVRLVGWGTLNNVPYWKIANSWNSDWGMEGYFLIKRGGDECGIESSGVGGVPAS